MVSQVIRMMTLAWTSSWMSYFRRSARQSLLPATRAVDHQSDHGARASKGRKVRWRRERELLLTLVPGLVRRRGLLPLPGNRRRGQHHQNQIRQLHSWTVTTRFRSIKSTRVTMSTQVHGSQSSGRRTRRSSTTTPTSHHRLARVFNGGSLHGRNRPEHRKTVDHISATHGQRRGAWRFGR